MGHHEDYLNKQLREKEEDQLRYEQTVNQLQTEERFVNFFKGYNPTSVEQFIKYYANMKVSWLRGAGNHERYAKERLERDRQSVVGLLESIMVKKLFNLKCRWVAGEMDLDGVEVSSDFENWRNSPSLLEAAGPITADEFYCYLDFFREDSERLDEDGMPEGSVSSAFSHYHDWRSNYMDDPEKEIPDWFYCYDRNFGTSHLMHLPTTRTDIEQDYQHEWTARIYYPSFPPEVQKTLYALDRKTRKRLKEDPEFHAAWMEERNRIYREQQEGKPQYESFSVYSRKIMEEVVKAIEPRDVQQMYRHARQWRDLSNKDEEMFTPLYYLKNVEEYVAVAANDDYRVSIREAYEEHRLKTNCQALEMLFGEYEECIRSGKPFQWGKANLPIGSGEIRQRILAVRELNGLPMDFDFLLKKNLP